MSTPRPDWLQGTVLLFDEARRRRRKWDREASLQLDALVERTEARKPRKARETKR